MKRTGIRVGKVSSIDYETGMMQIVYHDKDDAVTAKMPYANFNNEYCMPKIGEQVVVAHLSNGSSRGVVLGTMWNKKNIPEENGKALYRKELSKTPGAAYIRFDDEKGEYLIRSPVIMLHGVDRTDLEGPEVNIAANIRTSFESPEHEAALGSIHIAGLEGSDIGAEITNNVNLVMDMAALDALIQTVRLETVEELEMIAGRNLKAAGKNISMTADGDIRMEDKTFSTTLSEILGRLEALDHDTSARK